MVERGFTLDRVPAWLPISSGLGNLTSLHQSVAWHWEKLDFFEARLLGCRETDSLAFNKLKTLLTSAANTKIQEEVYGVRDGDDKTSKTNIGDPVNETREFKGRLKEIKSGSPPEPLETKNNGPTLLSLRK